MCSSTFKVVVSTLNRCMKCHYQLNIFPLDVPSAPEDISVHDIFQDSCILKWKKPKDDGGMPIVNYLIERQDLSVKGKLKVLYKRNKNSLATFCVWNRWMEPSWRATSRPTIVFQM